MLALFGNHQRQEPVTKTSFGELDDEINLGCSERRGRFEAVASAGIQDNPIQRKSDLKQNERQVAQRRHIQRAAASQFMIGRNQYSERFASDLLALETFQHGKEGGGQFDLTGRDELLQAFGAAVSGNKNPVPGGKLEPWREDLRAVEVTP
jgi:hypothetical protein